MSARTQVSPDSMGLVSQSPFLGPAASEALFAQLVQFRAAHPFGRPVTSRAGPTPWEQILVYFGAHNAGATYMYAGAVVHGQPAPDFLSELHRQVEAVAGVALGHALINAYSPGNADGTGEDWIGYHRDDIEAADGTDIHSYTVGGERFFRVRTDCPVLDSAYRWCKMRICSDTYMRIPHDVNATCFHGVPRSLPDELAELGDARNRVRFNITFRQRL
ncbi:MAG: hypothetical protein EBZ75_12040 [Oxalobacteraceae bacterium]|nr:hypothetical protein [Oxalobacteraceae bacterium]